MSPARNPRPCRHYPCNHLVPPPCPVHSPQAEKARNERRSDLKAIYDSRQWKTFRRRVLLQRPWCQWPRCTLPATDVDHVRPLPQPDPYDEGNVQALCHAHHSVKTAQDIAARRAGQAQPQPERHRLPTRRRRPT